MIEAIFASVILLLFVSGITFFIGIELSKLHISHTASDFLICLMQRRSSYDCEQKFNAQLEIIKTFGKVKITKTTHYNYSSSVDIEFSNRYSKWKLSKTLDLAPLKAAKALF